MILLNNINISFDLTIMKPIYIETSELIIQDINGQNFTELREIYNDQSILKYLEKKQYTDDEVYYRLKEIDYYRNLNLQIACKIHLKKNNQFIGFVRIDLYPTSSKLIQFNFSKSPVEELAPGAEYQCAYLLEMFQGMGYMGLVLNEIENLLMKLEIRYIFGSVNRGNKNCINFINKRGYQIIDKEPIDLSQLDIPILINKLNNEYFFIRNIQDHSITII